MLYVYTPSERLFPVLRLCWLCTKISKVLTTRYPGIILCSTSITSIISPFCNIWGCMCWTGPFKFRWLKGYIYNPSNRKYPPFPLLSYFSVVVCLRWLYYHILSSITYISREYRDLVSNICVQSFDVQSMVFANDRIHYGLEVVFVCLQITPSHYHHYADSSEGIELIKCLSGICLYAAECV